MGIVWNTEVGGGRQHVDLIGGTRHAGRGIHNLFTDIIKKKSLCYGLQAQFF